MSSFNASPGGAPPAQPSRPRRAGESHARIARTPTPSGARQHGGWARCEEEIAAEEIAAENIAAANIAAEVPAAAAPPKVASTEEPRTGVVRRMNLRPGARPGSSGARAPASSVRPERSRDGQRDSTPSDWRCLEEWSQPAKERRPRRNAKVTIVQLSRSGDLVRQNGPDAWLPEAGDFVQRMSRLLAQGLGFERCRSLCLKGPNTVLTVTEAGDTKLVAVTGPVRSMSNVLRRAGLE